MGEILKDNLLRSWKEISAYLGCDRRTCYRWEKIYAMPVHRAKGSAPRSTVFAYKDELDRWFRETYQHNGQAKGRFPRFSIRSVWPIPTLLTFLFATGLYFVGAKRSLGQPADFGIENSYLIIFDKSKREVWRWDTHLENLQPESYYRKHYQFINRDELNYLPSIVMRDIDNDGNIEVLFAPKRTSDQTGEGVLYCFNHKGTELWSFRGGKELVCGGKVFSPDYRIAGFDSHDIDRDGRTETIVYSFQSPDWPCQLAVLDSGGNVVGEFWNAGYLRELTYHDLNDDAREEIIIVGSNNQYPGGCLMVFDPCKIGGSSPQTDGFCCKGLGTGTEEYYLTFPYTDVAEGLNLVVDGIRNVEITNNRRVRATSGLDLRFEFDFNLKCLDVDYGHGFSSEHRRLVKTGIIRGKLNDLYKEQLKKAIRYWDGKAFVPEPAKNMPAEK